MSKLLWGAYEWIATRTSCCMVGCGCVVAPIFLLGGGGGIAALLHFT